ncbi:mitochondrial glycoprotein [Annulohypoxylon maeteangense]|uniref:mitochondrial glycoprotein n=1 Tax=Annulohypoxylon maeteangense TaxID=1927788 RepID=UPI002007E3DA|nr:mitochondrial glycoprotein [Annulohypoxylon maeteangense]KAI0886523.1 mitochondrial glycoprotein [Annulohypoxylon maeteangense]
MLSLRTVARSAPRTLNRLSSTALRQSRVARPSSLLKSSWAPLRSSQFASAFSTSQFRQAASEVDEELSVKLDSEIQFEGSMKEVDQLPASVKDFLENSPFELKDEPGKEDVTLTRKFNNETITVTFSISDLTNYENEDLYNEDALGEDEFESEGGNRQARQETDELLEDEEEEGNEAPVPCRLNVVVEKPGKGALNIEALAQDGQVMVENFYYFKDAKLAHGDTAEIAHIAQDVYPGPPFGTLDEDLQLLMERYLEERGVTQALAVFIPDYMDVKEQREYQAWLKQVKGFIDA